MKTNTKLLMPLIAAGALLAGCGHRDDAATAPASDNATPTSPSGAGDQSTTPGGNAGDANTAPGTPTEPSAPPPADATTPQTDSTQPSNPPPQQ